MSERAGFRGGRGGGGRGGYGQRGGGAGSRGGHASSQGGSSSSGQGSDREKPKRESIVDLNKYMDKEICVKFSGGREGEKNAMDKTNPVQ